MIRTAFILLLSLSLFNTTTKACSCGSMPPLDVAVYNATPMIFIGSVVSIDKSISTYTKYTFRVSKWYKGDNDTNTVVAYKYRNTMCPPYIVKGIEYVMFLERANEDGKPMLMIYNCSRSMGIYHDSITSKMSNTELQFAMKSSDTSFLNMMDQNIRKKGIQQYYLDNGAIMAEGAYEQGVPVGKWTYYMNGNLHAKGLYKNGQKEDVWKYYQAIKVSAKSEIRLIKEIEFTKGRFTGVFKKYNPYYQKIVSEGYPIKGTHNIMKKFYHRNGTLAESITLGREAKDRDIGYKEGNGPYKKYYDNGQLQEEGIYKKGFKTGEWKYYNDQGNLIKTTQELPPPRYR